MNKIQSFLSAKTCLKMHFFGNVLKIRQAVGAPLQTPLPSAAEDSQLPIYIHD